MNSGRSVWTPLLTGLMAAWMQAQEDTEARPDHNLNSEIYPLSDRYKKPGRSAWVTPRGKVGGRGSSLRIWRISSNCNLGIGAGEPRLRITLGT
jgi:hypothetical protein